MTSLDTFGKGPETTQKFSCSFLFPMRKQEILNQRKGELKVDVLQFNQKNLNIFSTFNFCKIVGKL